MERRTKIIATLGPASSNEPILEKMLKAGVNVVRLNFSHGTHETHASSLSLVRRLSDQLNCPVMLLQDLQGPKIRIGEIQGGAIHIHKGQTLRLTNQVVVGNEQIISVDLPILTQVVEPGSRILIDDGNLELKVKSVQEEYLETEVILGGILKSRKGVNLPGIPLNLPSLTEKDEEDLQFGLAQQIDAIALSFVQSANDIRSLRAKVAEISPAQAGIPIIAKLERPQALQNLDEIIEAADGVMVARGDLGVELEPEAVPIVQKNIINAANQAGKVVITATQMLESMINNPRPTRAESSDVANAIFDGTDAVMLSGETAIGKYPIASVEMMNAIICQAEKHMREWGHWKGPVALKSTGDDAYFITLAARELAHDRNVAAIAVFTQSGRTALLMSKVRPSVPILAFTPNLQTYKKMNLYWGVHPYLIPHAETIECMIQLVEKELLTLTPIQSGQQVVLICGFPVHTSRPANLALLHTVGESLRIP
jgi:pyruvate kinase